MTRPVGSRYLLEETLGRGATGTVWRARVRDTGEEVAIKVLREELVADQDLVTRFLRERSALLRLRHPNLVAVRDLVVEGELLALVMDLVQGTDLRSYLGSRGTLAPAEATRLMADVAEALTVVHAGGVVHRDLKPSNILIDFSHSVPRPLLSDFGIARLADSTSTTRIHDVLGTPAYLAPETVEGRTPTGAVDVYAAGIVLYELLTGVPPFRGDNSMAVMHMHREQRPERPAGMPEEMWGVVAACLAKRPGERPSAGGLADQLRRLTSRLESGAAGGRSDRTQTVFLPPVGGAADATRVIGRTPAAPYPGNDATRVINYGGDDATRVAGSLGNDATRMIPGSDATRMIPGSDATRAIPAADATRAMPRPDATRAMPAPPPGPEQFMRPGDLFRPEQPRRGRRGRGTPPPYAAPTQPLPAQYDQPGRYGAQGVPPAPPPAYGYGRQPPPYQPMHPPAPPGRRPAPDRRPSHPPPGPWQVATMLGRGVRGFFRFLRGLPGGGCLVWLLVFGFLLYLLWQLALRPIFDAIGGSFSSFTEQLGDWWAVMQDWWNGLFGAAQQADGVSQQVNDATQQIGDWFTQMQDWTAYAQSLMNFFS